MLVDIPGFELKKIRDGFYRFLDFYGLHSSMFFDIDLGKEPMVVPYEPFKNTILERYGKTPDEYGHITIYNDTYGVCDSPEQFYEDYGKYLISNPRNLFVSFLHIPKSHGWRWYKNGDYLGRGKPTSEYLNDEEGFSDGVYCFYIYDFDAMKASGHI